MGVVEFARQARRDLGSIAAYIARDNPARARTFRRELLFKAHSLDEHPRRGRVVPEFEDETVREILYGAYRIVYRVTAGLDRVLILRFWHGARGTPQILED